MTTEREWAREQLRLAGYDTKNPSRVSISNSVELLFAELDQMNHTPESRRIVVELFSKLATGHAIAPRQVQDVGARWVPFRLGNVPAGSTVRVKMDAYESAAGHTHNGMVGKLVAARGGYAVVQYSESSEGTGHRHAPDALEVLEKKS